LTSWLQYTHFLASWKALYAGGGLLRGMCSPAKPSVTIKQPIEAFPKLQFWESNLKGYWLAETETTQELFTAVMGHMKRARRRGMSRD
jgi:hypothetical protein